MVLFSKAANGGGDAAEWFFDSFNSIGRRLLASSHMCARLFTGRPDASLLGCVFSGLEFPQPRGIAAAPLTPQLTLKTVDGEGRRALAP